MTARAGAGPLRRLIVVRHAKSAWPVGVPDHERPLAPRGRRDAPAVGRALAEADCLPDLAVCSTAVRARQTWELTAAEWGTPPPVRHDARVYAAEVPELLDVVRETPDRVRTLLLVGHNPGLEELVLDLAGDALDDALDDVRAKFPTSAIAFLSWHGETWSALAPGTALLTDMIVARGRKSPKTKKEAKEGKGSKGRHVKGV
ncbi:histidine phosphatase family protein [Streptomyces caniscabiei]|uniref:SixA phosphatase family protein n=1 Tax=Streptomyces caniscabiei TaxID=2746961 RepID=UPI0029AB2400|nr:histidine phosphatase family protein [Streptomyces caniscabiei]MDX2605994.1 histidine phosphatase family protein [Streptomyces caniscabiei]MDX2735377.1 histidine phosphatase family protein [Streptomyces caniscabiei]MDX2779070.1 histidine phosphatase family protein [Streptomyces caniscabiei]